MFTLSLDVICNVICYLCNAAVKAMSKLSKLAFGQLKQRNGV